jgi:hypothetical protein
MVIFIFFSLIFKVIFSIHTFDFSIQKGGVLFTVHAALVNVLCI